MTSQTSSIPVTASERKRDTAVRGRSSTGTPPHAAGMVWFGGWLFTIGFANLVWWKVLLAVVIWPYFLGATLR